jgi:hypothetical protein
LKEIGFDAIEWFGLKKNEEQVDDEQSTGRWSTIYVPAASPTY